MWKDPIVQEVRKIREANAEKFGYNIKNIVEDARRRQKASKHRVISFAIEKQVSIEDLPVNKVPEPPLPTPPRGRGVTR